MTDDQARAILIVAALWTGATSGASFTAGRMTAPVPPMEVRYVTISIPTPVVVPEALPAEPVAIPSVVEPTHDPPAAPVETRPPPKAEPKPKAKPEKVIVKKPRAVVIRQREPTTDECEQMRFYGRTVVKAGGRARGYSGGQIERALRDCNL